MVFLEHKGEYTYLSKNIRLDFNKWKKIRKYLGLKDPNLNIKEEYLKHKDYFIEQEFELRKNFFPNLESELLKLSIEIENFLSLFEDKKKEIEIDFAKEFIYNSNKLEGSTLPKKDFIAIFNKRKVYYEDENEIKEAENSIKAWKYLRKEFSFNLVSIKKIYRILTNDLYMMGKYKYPKGFKILPNTVGGSETCSPENVQKELMKLILWYKDNKKKKNPLELAFEFYYRYEKIHPFQDGNGRTGRMLMNKILIMSSFPPIIIYDGDKIDQAIAFREYDNGNKKEIFYLFLIDQLRKTYERVYKKHLK